MTRCESACKAAPPGPLFGRFSNRPFGVKRFQTIRRCSVDVARGLVLLFGIGARALPAWDSRTRRNNLWVGLAVLQTVGPSGHANSPHPSSRKGHHSTVRWSSSEARQREARGRHFSAPAHRRTDEWAEFPCSRTNIGVFADVEPAKLIMGMLHLKQDFPSGHAIPLQSAMRPR